MMRRVLFAALLLIPGTAVPSGTAMAAEPTGYASEIADLSTGSTAVILGSIERKDIGVSETIALVRVIKSFAGPFTPGQAVQFRTRTGRVTVGKNQPELTGIDRAIFYLIAKPDGIQESVKDNYGFKPVINDHVYTNPQNPLETVRLKKYQESLLSVLKSTRRAG